MGRLDKRWRGLPIGILTTTALLGALPASALATHVTCGQRIDSSITLDNNVVDCPGNGLVVRDDNVTIDLNGYTIDGTANPDVVGLSAGVFVGPYSNVKIRNGIIRQFDNGVSFTGTSGSKLSNLTLNGNQSFGVVLSGASDNTLKDLIAFDNAHGILITAGSRDNDVIDNELRGNTLNGIAIAAGYQTYVADNEANNNGDDGIRVFDNASFTVLEDNRADNNLNDGIRVETESTTITRNRTDHNNFLGIESVPGIIDGGGNLARGNLNPFQCINVRCNDDGDDDNGDNGDDRAIAETSAPVPGAVPAAPATPASGGGAAVRTETSLSRQSAAPGAALDMARPLVRLGGLGTVVQGATLRRGLRFSLVTSEPATVTAQLIAPLGPRGADAAISRVRFVVDNTARSLTLKPAGRFAKRLRGRSLRVLVRLSVIDLAGNATVVKRVVRVR